MIGVLLSHYRIVEQIGAGGMGVVYRAHDEQLDRDVAIKVLPPGLLADETAHKRFRKEALSLARLNHPNIATIHEFGSENGVDFLVTEYIAGITLDVKLREGPLAPGEVMRLGTQLAAGLAAAHHEGIVHRDLKPGNLRLTGDGRVKILDFGLAQLTPHASELGMTATLTQSQETSGTLPYMSPEQLSGEMADARTDIWSAGAVLYEMATGKRPFVQSQPALLINAILNQSPELPSKVNPAVPAALEKVILRALARDRAARYQTASDLGADLERPSAAVAVAPAKRSMTAIVAVAVVVLALAAVALTFVWKMRNAASKATATSVQVPSVTQRRSIAVLGFKNLSGNPEKSWLSVALSEMLTTELSQGDQLRTIPGESVALMKASLALPDADSFSQQTLSRIRQNLGSDEVVLGSYIPLGSGLLRLDVRLQDTVAGITLASVSEKGNESEIDSLVGQAGAELRAKLGVSALSDAQSAVVRASLPANPDAARFYAQGLQKLRLFDYLSARDLIEKASALDPDYAPAHSALAEVWLFLGYDAKAKDQAKRAMELAGRSSPEEKLLIEGRAHTTLSEMPKAIESYRTLFEMFPDNLDYGLSLARVQADGGQAGDAQTTIAQLRRLTLSDADAARVDLAEAQTALILSDFKRAQSLAERGTTRGRAIGANLVIALGLQTQARAFERMGNLQQTVALCGQASELYEAAGDRRGAARCIVVTGDVLYDQGDFAGARKQFENALSYYVKIGAEKSQRAMRERIGNTFYSLGQMNEAKRHYEECLAFDHEMNDPGALASDYGNIANAMDALGDLSGALKMQKEALGAFNAVGDRRGAADTLSNTGNVLVEMGDLENARKYFDQSLALMREISYNHGEPAPTSGIGDTMFYRGDLAGARKQYEESLAMSKQLEDEDYSSQVSVALAALALAEKRYSDGETLAAPAAAHFEKLASWGNEAWSQAITARNQIGLGKVTEAEGSAAKAIKASQQSPMPTTHFEAALASAQVKAKSGKVAEARNELEAMVAATHKAGYRLYEYQGRLLLGEIEKHAGVAAANAHLSALESESRAHGALLIADRAHGLLEQSGKSK